MALQADVQRGGRRAAPLVHGFGACTLDFKILTNVFEEVRREVVLRGY